MNQAIHTESTERDSAFNMLREVAAMLIGRDVSVQAVSLIGDARYELARKATELNAAALVVGSRGMGRLQRMLLGSVSSHLAHNCSTPLVIIKRPEV
jgi:nucleotide-binding universal stress UspA family protein